MSATSFKNDFVSFAEILSHFSNVKTELDKERAWTTCMQSLVKKYKWLCRDSWFSQKFPTQVGEKELFEETLKSAFFESLLFTITKILNHSERFDLQSDIGAYLRIVFRNMAANAIRKVFNVKQSFKTNASTNESNAPAMKDDFHANSEQSHNFIYSRIENLSDEVATDSDFQEFPPESFALIQLDKYRNQVLHRLFPGNPPLCGETIRYRCLDGFSGQDLFILLEYAIDRHLSAANPNFFINWSLPDLNNEIQRRGGKPYSAVQGLSNAVHRVIDRFMQLSVQAKSTCKQSPGKPCACPLKSIGFEN